MRKRSVAVAALLASTPLLCANAQAKADSRGMPFLAGAVSAGALGFTNEPTSSALLGGYGYAAFRRFIIGAQGGGTIGARNPTDVLYGIATLAYPARSIRKSLVYPFIGVGGGVMHAVANGNDRGAVFGAGVGADHIHGEGDGGLMTGIRGGYLFRAGNAGERAVYLSVAIGAGGRRTQSEKPPVIVVARKR